MRPIRSAFEAFYAAYREWRADRAIRLGAGLAYYALFAAVPILTIAVAIAGILFSEAEIEAFLSDRLSNFLGGAVPELAPELAKEVDASSTFTSLGAIGAILLVVAASFFFVAMQDAFNILWGIPMERGVVKGVRRRLIGVVLVFLAGALLGATLLVDSIISTINNILPAETALVHALDGVLATAGYTAVGVGILILLFKLLIREQVAWRDLVLGCTATALMMMVGTWGFYVYLGRFASFSFGGVVGVLTSLLVWMYVMSQILLYGSELVKVLTRGPSVEADS